MTNRWWVVCLLQSVVPVLFLSLFAITPASAEWESAGTLNVPAYSYSFLAATPDGDLLATTYHADARKVPPRNMPALLVRNPMSERPEVVELCRTPFAPLRGYSGIACASDGSFYISADTGNAGSSFVRKFHENGTIDRTFANNGEIRTGHRCLGIDVLGNYLLIAIDWGQIRVVDHRTGRVLHTILSTGYDPLVRDIAFDPKSMRLFGVAEGGLVTWGGGVPWQPFSYQFRYVTPSQNAARAGEGVSLDPIKRTVLIAHSPGNTLEEIHGNGLVLRYPIRSATESAQLCDSVVSFDGSTLFVSDLAGQKVHVLRRDVDALLRKLRSDPIATARPRRLDVQTSKAPPVHWARSYTEAMEYARNNNKPMLLYFRRSVVPKCQEVEKNVLLSDEFNVLAQDIVCVFQNVDDDRLLAYRLGVHQVPSIALLDQNGETVNELRFNIEKETLLSAINELERARNSTRIVMYGGGR